MAKGTIVVLLIIAVWTFVLRKPVGQASSKVVPQSEVPKVPVAPIAGGMSQPKRMVAQ